MPLDTFKRRMADNVPGKIYVGDQCLDCDLCRQTAPENFGRNDDGGYSYVKKQPETPEEMAQCQEAIEGCHTDTIHDDGDLFDWVALPAPTPYHLTPDGIKGLRDLERRGRCCGLSSESSEDDKRPG
jgi:ferredoxin